jgi:hypothetical protein
MLPGYARPAAPPAAASAAPIPAPAGIMRGMAYQHASTTTPGEPRRDAA